MLNEEIIEFSLNFCIMHKSYTPYEHDRLLNVEGISVKSDLVEACKGSGIGTETEH